MQFQMQRQMQRQLQRQPEPQRQTEKEQQSTERDDVAQYLQQQKQRAERERMRQEDAARRVAREQERLLEAQKAMIREGWALYEKEKYGAPPILLALEAFHELEAFRAFLQQHTGEAIAPAVLNEFEREICARAQEPNALVAELEKELRSPSWFGRIPRIRMGRLAQVLQGCVVSGSVPDLGLEASRTVSDTRRLLRGSWSQRLALPQQALISIHRCAGRNIIQLGSSRYGSVFITLPHSLDPEALAEALLGEIRRVASKFIAPSSTIAVIDGDHQTLNYQRIFQDNVVVRTVTADCARFAKNLDAVLHREPPMAANTALHLALPRDKAELSAVFRAGGADWDTWSGAAPLWQNRASRQGFERQASASAQQVLASLATAKNVIVVVAHADGQTLYMPAPPPRGSELSAEQVMARRAEIAANRPLVYLFCCETAEVSGLKSFSQVLLDAGAAAVVAPQTTINAELSIDFFEAVVKRGTNGGGDPLAKFKDAERRTDYREMELWLG